MFDEIRKLRDRNRNADAVATARRSELVRLAAAGSELTEADIVGAIGTAEPQLAQFEADVAREKRRLELEQIVAAEADARAAVQAVQADFAEFERNHAEALKKLDQRREEIEARRVGAHAKLRRIGDAKRELQRDHTNCGVGKDLAAARAALVDSRRRANAVELVESGHAQRRITEIDRELGAGSLVPAHRSQLLQAERQAIVEANAKQ